MKVLYFAWVRERIGKSSEEIAVPPGVRTVSDLIDHLISLDETYAHVFENRTVIRAALDQVHVKPDATLDDAEEIAFFPPMTGG